MSERREQPVHPALARRFLHVCLNTTSSAAAVAFHEVIADLSVRMATGVQRSAGSVLDIGELDSGNEQTFVAETTFLYDHRGPRVAAALEIVHWIDPPTTGETFGTPAVVGLHALTYAVPAVADRVRAARVEVLAPPGEGLLRPGSQATLVRDPDGVLVELLDTRPGEQAESRGVRLSCRDLDATIAWYTGIGFTVEVAPTAVTVAAASLGAEGDLVDVRAARMTLFEEPSFALTIVERPEASRPDGREPRHRGLYRMALRVENVNDALAVLDDAGVAYEGPKWIPMPGTKIGGLTIAFLHDPDGILVELVERPDALVGQPAIRATD